MPRPTSGADHLDAMQDFLKELPDACRAKDWPRLHALAAAAQVELSAAEFLRRAEQSDAHLDRRVWGRWAEVAGRS